jgi:transportin-1
MSAHVHTAASAMPPSASTLLLLATLSNPAVTPHAQHTEALVARDRALAASPASYGQLCVDFARTLAMVNPATLPESEQSKLALANSPALEALQVDPNGWVALRQMAGLLLKNALVAPPPANPDPNTPRDGLGRPAGGYMQLSPECAAEIKHMLLQCLAEGNANIRRVASTTISAASMSSESQRFRVVSLPLASWPQLLPFLLQCIEAGLSAALGPDGDAAAAAALDGALLTLRKMLEDAPRELEEKSGPAFGSLIPLLLKTFRSPDEKAKKEGLRCLNNLIETFPAGLVVHMNDYLGGLSAMAADASWEVRRLVCQAIVTMLSLRTEYLQPHFSAISEFILNATADESEDVALEACEFWLTFASLEEDVCSPDMYGYVQQILPRLMPILLKGMVYSEEKREELMDDNALDESNAADRVQDVAPIFHSSSAKRGGDESDDGGNGDDPDDDNEWNVRKCSAASLDSLANMYGPEHILPPLLPLLQESLSHSDPWVREAGLLALGAIADGCENAMAEHMGQLHPFMMAQLTDAISIPQLKMIAAWCLGRYSNWAVGQVHNGQPDILGKMTEALMGRILDVNRKVQVAICSAFGVLVEVSGDLLTPYLEPVYRTFVQALNLYHTRSLITLFDVMGSMADYLGPIIGEGQLPAIIVPPLQQFWHQAARNNPLDRTIMPLVECLASTALVMGSNYQPWALQTFDGAMSMIERCLMHLSTMDENYFDEEADPIVCASDLLDGLVEGLGANFPALLSSSTRYGEHFLGVLHTLTHHEVAGVRMSAFALFGDLARQAPAVIQPGMNELMSEAIACIDAMFPSVCNNAVWSIGEICVKCENSPQSLQPFAKDIVDALITLLMGNAVNSEGHALVVPGIAENAAATMGRLAKVNAGFVAPDLGRFLLGWCEGMAKIADQAERRDAFQGFIVALRANPQALHQACPHDPSNAIPPILFAVSSWHIPDGAGGELVSGSSYAFSPFPAEEIELRNMLASLLQEIKASLGEAAWHQIEKSLPVNLRRLFRENYGL